MALFRCYSYIKDTLQVNSGALISNYTLDTSILILYSSQRLLGGTPPQEQSYCRSQWLRILDANCTHNKGRTMEGVLCAVVSVNSVINGLCFCFFLKKIYLIPLNKEAALSFQAGDNFPFHKCSGGLEKGPHLQGRGMPNNFV